MNTLIKNEDLALVFLNFAIPVIAHECVLNSTPFISPPPSRYIESVFNLYLKLKCASFFTFALGVAVKSYSRVRSIIPFYEFV